MERFEELLKELGEIIHLPLKATSHHTCGITTEEKLQLLLQADDRQQRMLVSTFISEIPPGRFQTDLFKEALKTNAHHPRVGILGYSSKNNQLLLFEYLPFIELNGEKLAFFLSEFIAVANEWKTAIEKGKPSPKGATSGKQSLPPPFGMKP